MALDLLKMAKVAAAKARKMKLSKKILNCGTKGDYGEYLHAQFFDIWLSVYDDGTLLVIH